MNKIIREHVPVIDLPENLRLGLDPEAKARVTIEVEGAEKTGKAPVSLQDLYAMAQPPYRTMDEIVADVRRVRDEWDD